MGSPILGLRHGTFHRRDPSTMHPFVARSRHLFCDSHNETSHIRAVRQMMRSSLDWDELLECKIYDDESVLGANQGCRFMVDALSTVCARRQDTSEMGPQDFLA